MTSPHQVPGPSPKTFVGPPLRSFESFGQVPASPSVPAHTSSDVMMAPATNKRAMHRKLILASPSDQLLLLHVAAQRWSVRNVAGALRISAEAARLSSSSPGEGL